MTTPRSDQRPPARVPAWAWVGALAGLMVLTSLAVASVKVWLVLPYLALMAVILFTPPGRRDREKGRGAGEDLAEDRAGAGIVDEAVEPASAVPSPSADAEPPAPDSNSEPRGVKTRRGKGRGRRAKAVAQAASPGATASWIQIGPGKFVRVESPDPATVDATSPTAEPEPESEGEGKPTGSLAPSSGTAEGPTDDPPPPDQDQDQGRDAEAPVSAEAPFATEGEESEVWPVPASDETAVAATDPTQVEGDLAPAPGPEHADGSADAFDEALATHYEAPAPERDGGEPADSWATSSGTGTGTPVDFAFAFTRDPAPDPAGVPEVAPAAEAASPAVVGMGRAAWAEDGSAAVEPAGVEPFSVRVEDHLEPGPGRDQPAQSADADADDAAPAVSTDAPPVAGEPADYFAPRPGIGERSAGPLYPDDVAETEAVPTAEEPFATGAGEGEGTGTRVEDGAAPAAPTANPPASIPAGGNPGPGWRPAFASESAGVGFGVVLGTEPIAIAPPLAAVASGDVAGTWLSEVEVEVTLARVAADQALAEIAEATVAGELPAAALEGETNSEDGFGMVADADSTRDNGNAPDAFDELTGDNGNAPDAFDEVAPAEIAHEEVSPRDRGAGDRATSAPCQPPQRPGPAIGRSLASWCGPWPRSQPRVGPSLRGRSGPGATSPGRIVRSVRRTRVTPGLRRPSRRSAVRPRPACRTFPPRSPPALSGRS